MLRPNAIFPVNDRKCCRVTASIRRRRPEYILDIYFFRYGLPRRPLPSVILAAMPISRSND